MPNGNDFAMELLRRRAVPHFADGGQVSYIDWLKAHPTGNYADYTAYAQQFNPLASAQVTPSSNQITADSAGTPGTGAPGQISLTGPQTQISTVQSGQDSGLLGAQLASLNGQAANGNGAWQTALQGGTNKAVADAQALGQSSPGLTYQASLRNIANGQAAAQQRAAGQSNLLRNQQEMSAQQLAAGAYNSQGQQDLGQAVAQSAATQGTNALNAENGFKSAQNTQQVVGGIAQGVGALASALSGGGAVPGKSKVDGDNEKNDTVPALLSPGEIVLPRSVVNAPDAPSAAAHFVAALAARHGTKGVPHFDEGGAVPWYQVDSNKPNWNDSVANGGQLDATAFNQNRQSALANDALIQRQATGQGASTVPQQTQNANDSALAAAQSQQANARGQGAAASQGNAIMTGTTAAQQGAGQAGVTAATEQQRGQQAYIQALTNQRAQDMAMAQAQQGAAFRNAQINAGVSLQNQALLKGYLGAAGQAAVTGAGIFGDKYDASAGSDLNPDVSRQRADEAFGSNEEPSAAGAGDFDVGSGDFQTAAHGGVIQDTRADDFVAALKRRAR